MTLSWNFLTCSSTCIETYEKFGKQSLLFLKSFVKWVYYIYFYEIPFKTSTYLVCFLGGKFKICPFLKFSHQFFLITAKQMKLFDHNHNIYGPGGGTNKRKSHHYNSSTNHHYNMLDDICEFQVKIDFSSHANTSR